MQQSQLNFTYITEKLKSELKSRLFIILIVIVIFRIGSFIPIPGISTVALVKLIEHQTGTILEMFNVFSGGALSRASIFSLGVMPCISSSIIMQLLNILYPSISEIKKEGELGKKRINQYSKYITLILSIFQSIGVTNNILKIPGMHNTVVYSSTMFYMTAIVSLVCGSMFLMWLGEQITKKGIGNGISIIIFAGILAGLPHAIYRTIERVKEGNLDFFSLILVILFIFLIIFLVTFIERSQRRIPVRYIKHQHNYRVNISQLTHLPLKINMSGVMPAIFSSSIILFLTTIISWLGNITNLNWLIMIPSYLQPGKLFYILIYAFAIVLFCFFYTVIIFNSREIAENLKKSGAFIPGIRPGEQTSKYIYNVVFHLTIFGAIYIVFICLIPEFIRHAMGMPFYFGGTSLLIVILVIIDFISQIQTLIISSYYQNSLNKINVSDFNDLI